MFECCQWHALERSEQAKYYEMARKEKELHMQLYPGWSARDNYATRTKKKKMKRDVGAATSNYETKLGIFSGLLFRSLFPPPAPQVLAIVILILATDFCLNVIIIIKLCSTVTVSNSLKFMDVS